MSSSRDFPSLKLHQEHASQNAQLKQPTLTEMWIVSVPLLWFVAGLFLDGWAHNHKPELESFFTPWHAVFYSGYVVTAISFLCIVWSRMRRYGGTFFANVPEGFGYAFVGAGFFIVGGIGDLLWHEIFGIEADIDALLSPTHLVLAVSGFLMLSTGLRVWFREHPTVDVPNIRTQIPMFISASLMISLVWFMTQFSHFIGLHGVRPEDVVIADTSQSLAITGYLFHIAVITGSFLFIARHARVAFGGFTLIFTFSMLAMALMLDGLAFVPAGFAGGIVADILSQKLYPFTLHRNQVRAFGFIVPAAFFAAYFLTLSFTIGIWWSIHLWTGSIVMAGLAGLLTTFLVLPLKEGDER